MKPLLALFAILSLCALASGETLPDKFRRLKADPFFKYAQRPLCMYLADRCVKLNLGNDQRFSNMSPTWASRVAIQIQPFANGSGCSVHHTAIHRALSTEFGTPEYPSGWQHVYITKIAFGISPASDKVVKLLGEAKLLFRLAPVATQAYSDALESDGMKANTVRCVLPQVPLAHKPVIACSGFPQANSRRMIQRSDACSGYMCLQAYKGPTLKDFFKDDGVEQRTFRVTDLSALYMDMMYCQAYLHLKMGVEVRDINTSNVCIRDLGEPVWRIWRVGKALFMIPTRYEFAVIDFGLRAEVTGRERKYPDGTSFMYMTFDEGEPMRPADGEAERAKSFGLVIFDEEGKKYRATFPNKTESQLQAYLDTIRIPASMNTNGFQNETDLDERRVILGRNSMLRVSNTQAIPARFAVSFSSNDCSGVVIGPRHVLTSGSCVHSGGPGGRRHTYDWVAPGRNGGTFPYGTYRVVETGASAGWEESSEIEEDWGFIIVDRDFADRSGRRIGNMRVSLDYNNQIHAGSEVRMRGYPSRSPTGSMWFSYGRLDSRTTPQLMYSREYDTIEPGSTGSGVYASITPTGQIREQPVVLAVHSRRVKLCTGRLFCKRRSFNVAARIRPLTNFFLCLFTRGASCAY